jgi:hypothetical protein
LGIEVGIGQDDITPLPGKSLSWDYDRNSRCRYLLNYPLGTSKGDKRLAPAREHVKRAPEGPAVRTAAPAIDGVRLPGVQCEAAKVPSHGQNSIGVRCVHSRPTWFKSHIDASVSFLLLVGRVETVEADDPPGGAGLVEVPRQAGCSVGEPYLAVWVTTDRVRWFHAGRPWGSL